MDIHLTSIEGMCCMAIVGVEFFRGYVGGRFVLFIFKLKKL